MASQFKNLSEYKKDDLNVNPETKIGIVVSEWNEEITGALAEGALNALIENGLTRENIKVKFVPGTFELALGAQWLLEYSDVEAVLCLGCVIQGETRHFDFICNAAANAIAKLSLDYHVPVIFGVLTTNDMQQAQDRAGGKHGNKGIEAAITALKMIALENALHEEDYLDLNLN
jgi:6,7-dimethyl-8-ribityllumazine synthase